MFNWMRKRKQEKSIREQKEQWLLEIRKTAFHFNIKWREKSNQLELDRQQAAIELAKKAMANGENVKVIFALLSKSQAAKELLRNETDVMKINSYQNMSPPQIAMSRATATSLGHGIASTLRTDASNVAVEVLDEKVKDLREDKAHLSRSLTQKDEQVMKAFESQGSIISKFAPTKPVVYKEHCPQCDCERTFKDHKCITCGYTP